jgi:hypothetical protein
MTATLKTENGVGQMSNLVITPTTAYDKQKIVFRPNPVLIIKLARMLSLYCKKVVWVISFEIPNYHPQWLIIIPSG